MLFPNGAVPERQNGSRALTRRHQEHNQGPMARGGDGQSCGDNCSRQVHFHHPQFSPDSKFIAMIAAEAPYDAKSGTDAPALIAMWTLLPSGRSVICTPAKIE